MNAALTKVVLGVAPTLSLGMERVLRAVLERVVPVAWLQWDQYDPHKPES